MTYCAMIRKYLKRRCEQLGEGGSIIEQIFPDIRKQSPLSNKEDQQSYAFCLFISIGINDFI